MKPRIICAALAVLALSVPAAAQDSEAPALPPDEILTILYMAGLDPIGRPSRNGTNYVIRAIDADDREVRVVISANSGDILSKTSVATASRIPPASNRTRSRGGYDAGPTLVDDDDSPSSGFLRPLTPGAALRPQPRSSNAPRPHPRGGPMQPDKDGNASAPSYLNIIVDEPGRSGVSPSRERSPQRAAPTVSPKPVDRTAAVPPKPEPLPKPRPDANTEAVPLPSSAPAESKRQPASLPMPPIPPRSSNATRSLPRGGTTQPNESGLASAPSKPNVNTDEPDRDGVLPPPPRRAAPAVSPKPVDRTAAVPPKPEPLPRPRRDANIEAVPPSSPSPPAVSTHRPVSAPMLLTPSALSNAAPPPRGGTTQPNRSGNASAPSAPNVIMADPDPIPPPPERLPQRHEVIE